MPNLALNKRAGFDYEILEKFEAGISLFGHEVKSIKTGRLSIKEAFVTARGQELFLTNAFVPSYGPAGNIPTYETTRPRKLLLHKSEIKKLVGKIRTEGLTLVPIRVYTRKRLIKLEFALGKGKKKFDKRETIQRREAKRRIQRKLRG